MRALIPDTTLVGLNCGRGIPQYPPGGGGRGGGGGGGGGGWGGGVGCPAATKRMYACILAVIFTRSV